MLNKIRNVLGLSNHSGSCHQSKAKPLQKHSLIFSVFILCGDSGLTEKNEKEILPVLQDAWPPVGAEIVLEMRDRSESVETKDKFPAQSCNIVL